MVLPPDSPEVELPYPFKDGVGGPGGTESGGLYLDNPKNVTSGFEYDPETGTYNYYEKIGDYYFKYPTYMDFDEYIQYDSKKSLQDYWKQKSDADDLDQTKGFRPQLTVKGEHSTEYLEVTKLIFGHRVLHNYLSESTVPQEIIPPFLPTKEAKLPLILISKFSLM